MNQRTDSNCDICGKDMRTGNIPYLRYGDVLLKWPNGREIQFCIDCLAELPVRIKALEEKVAELQRGMT